MSRGSPFGTMDGSLCQDETVIFRIFVRITTHALDMDFLIHKNKCFRFLLLALCLRPALLGICFNIPLNEFVVTALGLNFLYNFRILVTREMYNLGAFQYSLNGGIFLFVVFVL